MDNDDINIPKNLKGFLRLGEICFASSEKDVDELAQIFITLITRDDVQRYLQVVESKKRGGSYTG